MGCKGKYSTYIIEISIIYHFNSPPPANFVAISILILNGRLSIGGLDLFVPCHHMGELHQQQQNIMPFTSPIPSPLPPTKKVHKKLYKLMRHKPSLFKRTFGYFQNLQSIRPCRWAYFKHD